LVRVSIICALSVGWLGLSGCSSGGELPKQQPDNGPPSAAVDPNVLRLPFLVDDYFVPNGCFGDDNCAGDVININSRACQDTPASVQSVCRLYTYQPLAKGAPGYQGFLGILFQDVVPGTTEIGRVPGVAVQPGAQRVVFWAKVGVGPIDVAFRAGGANNWEGNTDPTLPYKDDFGVPRDVTLTKDYQQISIDLTGVTYKDVVSPFGWAIKSQGRTDAIELYIADLRWE
jgi:hypothetical protein